MAMKTLKEYLGISTIRVGGLDSIHPIASLGDTPPKGKGSRDSRATGLVANYTTQGVGTIKPMLTANTEKKKIEMMKLTRKAMSTMPGSQKQKEIKIQLNKVRKELGLDPIKEETLNEKIGYVVRYTDSKNKKFATAFKMKKDAENKSNQLKKSGMKDISITTHNINYNNQISFRGLDKPLSLEDTNRVPRKPGQKAGSDKHSDLYTDENPKGTIHGLGFTDAETARTSVNKIKNSGKTHAHKIQAAIAMSQRAKVASERAKDPKKKKDLGAAHRVYQSFIDTNKKKD